MDYRVKETGKSKAEIVGQGIELVYEKVRKNKRCPATTDCNSYSAKKPKQLESITGIDVRKHKSFYRQKHFLGGYDFNGFGTKDSYKAGEFNEKYGFGHGHKDYLIHLYISTSSNYLV